MEKTAAAPSIEVKVISAEGLRLNRRLIKKNAFVIVRTDSNNYRSTTVDTEGGSYPFWNEKFILPLPNSVKFVTVEVQCKTSSRMKMVGTAKIPVSDFLGDYTPAFYLHFLSYRLRESDGEPNGIINLSIKLNVPENVVPSWLPRKGIQPSLLPPKGIQLRENHSGGIVVGMPISYGYKM